MKLIVQNSPLLSGMVIAPSSKSQSIRAVIFSLLAQGKSNLTNVLESDDVEDALRAARNLGAEIMSLPNQLIISSAGFPFKTNINMINTGNSGITTHFIMPILGLRKNFEHIITLDCGEQMRDRPVHPLVNALRSLGLTIKYVHKENLLPIIISGQLTGGITEVSGLTSQYLSALLVALPCAEKDSVITVKNLRERSYMDMTLAWLKQQKIDYVHSIDGETDTFKMSGKQQYQTVQATIAGDFSSASYLIAAGVFTPGTIDIHGLNMEDPQSDKRLISILQQMGADISLNSERVIIRGSKTLQGIMIDASDIPDLLPTLAVLGTYAQGKTTIKNVAHARIKETDRIHSMTDGLTRLGAKIEEHEDGMTIYHSTLEGAEVDGYGDHRTVMALSLAGMLAENITTINGCEAINKTFPDFITMMQSLGAKMEVQDV